MDKYKEAWDTLKAEFQANADALAVIPVEPGSPVITMIAALRANVSIMEMIEQENGLNN